MTLPTECRHAIRLVDSQGTCSHLGIKESRGHNIYPGKIPPLTCKGLPKVRYTGFGGIVDRLIDRDVDNVGTHARGDDKVAEALPFENFTDVLSREDNTVDYKTIMSVLWYLFFARVYG